MNTIQNGEKPIIVYPEDFVQLGYTTHARSRLVERTSGQIIVAPTLVRVTEKNTMDIETMDGLITNCTISIDYKRNTKMFLCLSMRYPNFATVKTVYFKNAKKKHKTIKENTYKEEKQISPAEDSGGRGGERKKNVGDVSRNMGGKKASRWEKLFRAIRRVFRKRTKINIL